MNKENKKLFMDEEKECKKSRAEKKDLYFYAKMSELSQYLSNFIIQNNSLEKIKDLRSNFPNLIPIFIGKSPKVFFSNSLNQNDKYIAFQLSPLFFENIKKESIETIKLINDEGEIESLTNDKLQVLKNYS